MKDEDGKSRNVLQSKELLKNEIFTREDHIKKLLSSKTQSKPEMSFARSSVLDRVRHFLPVANADTVIPSEDQTTFEVDDDYEGPVIEMNLQMFPMLGSDDSSDSSDDDMIEKLEKSSSTRGNPIITVLDSDGTSPDRACDSPDTAQDSKCSSSVDLIDNT